MTCHLLACLFICGVEQTELPELGQGLSLELHDGEDI